MKIYEYQNNNQDAVIKLILEIQKKEYGLQITLEDQPDLLTIPSTYQVKSGGFWVAFSGTELIGTIALLPLANQRVALRKMFVKKVYRGKELNVAQQLLGTAFEWCRERKCEAVFLGTTDKFKAAHRFYEKNKFKKIMKTELPADFPVLEVDSVFYRYELN